MPDKKHRSLVGAICALSMAAMIIDAKTALQGAKEGLQLCSQTVIPALFPFFIISILLTNVLFATKSRLFSPICRLCGIADNVSFLLPIGLLGGYPIGAQTIAQGYRAGQLSKEDAGRMLGFCNNAGPAFIFGITGILFDDPTIPWLIWAIQILSALTTGALLPKSNRPTQMASPAPKAISVTEAMKQALQAMASVCGWIVLFRVLIQFIDRWFLWLLPEAARALLIGALELSNGCFALLQVNEAWVRFVLCTVMLASGGLCITMQTASVTAGLGLGNYIKGKAIQMLLALCLSCAVCPIVFEVTANSPLIFISIATLSCISVFLRILFKNNSRNPAISVV